MTQEYKARYYCYRVYMNGNLMSTYRDEIDALNAERQLQFSERCKYKDPYLYERHQSKIEVRKEEYQYD